jgi:nucleotide-binding universal stress UspA family protein
MTSRTHHPSKMMKVLLPVDESPYSAEAVQEVTERPWPEGTRIRVLSAVEIIGPPPMGPLMYDAGGSFDQLQRQRTKRASQLTERVANSLAAHGLATETAVREGDPRSVIVNEAEHWKANLIVLGSHGYTGIKKWLLGSVAQSVVSHAPCSVEVVRHRAAKAS